MHSRRNFLKTSLMGVGALSLSPCMRGLAADAPVAAFPKRFIFIRKSNGLRPLDLALPTFSAKDKLADERKQALEVDLDGQELPVWLQGLEQHKENMTILQGLSSKMSENGHTSNASVMGAYNSKGSTISRLKWATIDFELAKLFPSPFGHIELSLAQDHGLTRKGIVPGYSASAPYQRNYCYADAETAYNEVFKAVVDPESMRSEEAMLRFLEEDDRFKASHLQGNEQLKLGNHVASIEALRKRNAALAGYKDRIGKHLPTLDKVHFNDGQNATTPQKHDAFTEILLSAMISGLTNVVTYTIDNLVTPITGLPGNEGDRIGIHDIGHNTGYSGRTADQIREQMRIEHMRQVSRIVETLKAQPEGNGTMFDNTMIMYFPEGGEAHHGQGTEAPFVILSGRNCSLDIAGRYIRLPYHATEGHKTLGNWYTTLLNAHGNPIKHYGEFDLEMLSKKMDQQGAIGRFIG